MRRAAPTPEQIECKRQVRNLERQVLRLRYPKRVPCRRWFFKCPNCAVRGNLLIELPHVDLCPVCRSDLEWRRVQTY